YDSLISSVDLGFWPLEEPALLLSDFLIERQSSHPRLSHVYHSKGTCEFPYPTHPEESDRNSCKPTPGTASLVSAILHYSKYLSKPRSRFRVAIQLIVTPAFASCNTIFLARATHFSRLRL